MKLHSREVNFTEMSEDEFLQYATLAAELSKNHLNALKEQLQRQGVDRFLEVLKK